MPRGEHTYNMAADVSCWPFFSIKGNQLLLLDVTQYGDVILDGTVVKIFYKDDPQARCRFFTCPNDEEAFNIYHKLISFMVVGYRKFVIKIP